MRTNTIYSSASFNIYYDTQDPDAEGWAYNFVGTTTWGELVTQSGPIDSTRDLIAALVYAPADYDMSELPTFGGPEPEGTEDVYSWDATHLIVGCPLQGLVRVPR